MDDIKISFKKTVSKFCYFLLVSILIANVWVVFPIAIFGEAILGNLSLVALLTQPVMAITFILLTKNQNIFCKEDKKNEKVSIAVGGCFIALGLLIAIIAGYSASFIEYIFSLVGLELKTVNAPVSNSIMEFLLNSLATAVVPAVTEELMFRGVILNSLNKYNRFAAILISALLFAIFHGNIPQFIFTLALGVYWGFVFSKTKSLGLCMLMHFAVNFYSVTCVALSKILESNPWIEVVLFFIIFFVGAFSFIFLKRKGLFNFSELEKQDNLISSKNCYKLAFSSHGMIVFIVVMAIFICTTVGPKVT